MKTKIDSSPSHLASYPGLPTQLFTAVEHSFFSQPWILWLRKKLCGKAWVRGYLMPALDGMLRLEKLLWLHLVS